MSVVAPATRRTALLVLLASVGFSQQQPSAQSSAIPSDLVLYAADAAAMNGTWQRITDATAAGGLRLWHPDAGATKITAPSATPRDYFELSFQAEAGLAYRLWLRGLAQANSYNNDSVYVQFSGSVDANGAPLYRIGTTSGTAVVIENCSGCGVSGWGWQDNEYGGTSLGPAIYFATTGPQTLRIQAREDGISIDQIVLSSSAYFTTRPGAVKNDATVLPKTEFGSTGGTGGAPAAVSFSTSDYAAGGGYALAAVTDVNGDGKPDVVGFYDNEPLEFKSYTNNGDRTFTNAQFLEDVGGGQEGALALAVADFTQDGKKDVLFLHGTANALWLGTGDGTGRFTFGTGAIAFVEKVTDFATADFNRDGILDVVAIEPDRNSAVVYLGDGTGHVSFVSYGTTAATPSLVTTGDLDGDGLVDAVVLSMATDVASILYGDGTGRFRARGDLNAGAAPRGVAIGDLNRDGRPDLALENAGGVTVYLAAPGGGWQPARVFDTTQTWTGLTNGRNLAIADMNSDGMPDLIVGHNHGRADIGSWTSASVLYGDGSGGFSAPDEFSIGAYNPFAVADFDADGRPDIFAPDYASVSWNAPFSTNHAPVANAGPDATVAVSQESTVSLWSRSTDSDRHLLKTSWKDESGREISDGPLAYPFKYVQKPAGTYTFTLTVDDMHGGSASDTVIVTITSDTTGVNHPPVADARVTLNGVWPYEMQFQDEPDPTTYFFSNSTDPDGDPLAYDWRDENGTLLGTDAGVDHANLLPGTHTITLTVRDGRGGVSQDSVSIQVLPYEEINISMGYKEWTQGQWHETELASDSGGPARVVIGDNNNGAPKMTAPLASPASYASLGFVADPTLEYKLWVRVKAQNDYWGNDSVWVQFDGATDANGNAIFRTGTTSGLMVNLEECSGCGLSGWGWRDEAWGTAGAMGSTVLRFPQGGVQSLSIQTREDGVMIDQVVLSARKYKTTRPGTVKNDATILPFTAMWGS